MKSYKSDVTNNPAGFVLLADYVPGIIQEIRYYSTYNFIGDRIDGYEEPCALLTKEAARALKAVSNEMMVRGYRLKVFDAYRPVSAVRHFVLWGIEDQDIRMKQYFYPELEKQELFEKGYIAKRSSHSRGSTVDLTLFDMASGKELDMGSPFDLFSAVQQPHDPEERHAAQRLSADRLRVVAFHPGGRAISRHLLFLPRVLGISEKIIEIKTNSSSRVSELLHRIIICQQTI